MIERLVGDVSYRFIRVWQRDLTVFSKTWKVGLAPSLLEPVLYLVAFGAGLGALVGTLHIDGRTVSYIRFIAPALIAVTVMQNAFFETTYSSFVRMYYQKTFNAMLATPLSLAHVITGEIAWAATRSAVAAARMLAVITPFGLLSYPLSLLVVPLALLGGFAFGAAGMWFTGVVPTIDMFNLPMFLFITPMFLFSGTFFPLENLPQWARYAAMALPLTHLVELTRAFTFGRLDLRLLWNLGYLLLFAAIAFPLAMGRMRARLIT